jgi:hypothetical protein
MPASASPPETGTSNTARVFPNTPRVFFNKARVFLNKAGLFLNKAGLFVKGVVLNQLEVWSFQLFSIHFYLFSLRQLDFLHYLCTLYDRSEDSRCGAAKGGKGGHGCLPEGVC